ncbi:MAG TPA: alpha/beta hydrolase [Casimicrobiaceae bacterium]|nr:alpha/beta hydrolase [Casimicrobiaceae bacterium]
MNAKEALSDTAHAWPERGVSILNGMLGDYLQKRGNDLAISMSFRHRGRPIKLTEAGLRAVHASLSGRLCVLVHGFCCNESVWTFPRSDLPGSTYGGRLQRDLGYTPFYIRYNTGLQIAESGAHLANLLHDLAAAYPVPIDEITLIGHSMGGLVMRSACDSARAGAADWQGRVKRAIYIGTPHDGADLERFAHMTTGTLRAIPTHVTRLIGDILNLRSRGVKDLAAGHPKAESGSQPWLASARHYLLMGTLTKDPEHPVGRMFGDALVRVPRAAAPTEGQTSSPEIIVFPGVHHLALAHDESIYRCIRQICAGE